jgi:hypothetical protein
MGWRGVSDYLSSLICRPVHLKRSLCHKSPELVFPWDIRSKINLKVKIKEQMMGIWRFMTSRYSLLTEINISSKLPFEPNSFGLKDFYLIWISYNWVFLRPGCKVPWPSAQLSGSCFSGCHFYGCALMGRILLPEVVGLLHSVALGGAWELSSNWVPLIS